MQRTNRSVLIAATIGVMLTGAGCGGNSADSAAWAGTVCGSFTNFITVTSAQPTIDKSSPQAVITSISTYAGTVAGSLDEARTKLQAAGPSPIPNGDAALQKTVETVGQYRDKFQKAKTNLDQVDPNDSNAINTAVEPIMGIADDDNPLKPLEDIAEFKTAEAASPQCQQFIKYSETAGK